MEEKRKCNICSKQFSATHALHRHIRNMHENSKRRVKCNQCDVEMVPESMSRHIRSKHSGEMKITCSECGGKFAVVSINRHKKICKKRNYETTQEITADSTVDTTPEARSTTISTAKSLSEREGSPPTVPRRCRKRMISSSDDDQTVEKKRTDNNQLIVTAPESIGAVPESIGGGAAIDIQPSIKTAKIVWSSDDEQTVEKKRRNNNHLVARVPESRGAAAAIEIPPSIRAGILGAAIFGSILAWQLFISAPSHPSHWDVEQRGEEHVRGSTSTLIGVDDVEEYRRSSTPVTNFHKSTEYSVDDVEEYRQSSTPVTNFHKLAEYSCALCSASFEKKNELTRHILNNHPDSEMASKYTCPVCGDQFGSRRTQTQHIMLNRCKERQNIVCPTCNCNFGSVPALREHFLSCGQK